MAEPSPYTTSQNDVLLEHLGYAIDLVALSLHEIAEPAHADPDREWYRRMSIIEVFWGQARILIEFFTGAIASSTTAAAEHFTNKSLRYEFPKAEQLKDMRNDQIAHMNYARTRKLEEKLQPEDMYLTAAAIDRALDLFANNLSPTAKDLWERRVSGYAKIRAEIVYLSESVSACTVLSVATSDTTGTLAGTIYLGLAPTGPRGSPQT